MCVIRDDVYGRFGSPYLIPWIDEINAEFGTNRADPIDRVNSESLAVNKLQIATKVIIEIKSRRSIRNKERQTHLIRGRFQLCELITSALVCLISECCA